MRTVSDLLGHSSVAFTMNCYSHSATKLKREQMEKINEYFVFYLTLADFSPLCYSINNITYIFAVKFPT